MTSDLVWVLIRQDDGANRYRVGRYATRAEAERMADRLDGQGRLDGLESGPGVGQANGQEPGEGRQRRYVVERIAPRMAQT